MKTLTTLIFTLATGLSFASDEPKFLTKMDHQSNKVFESLAQEESCINTVKISPIGKGLCYMGFKYSRYESIEECRVENEVLIYAENEEGFPRYEAIKVSAVIDPNKPKYGQKSINEFINLIEDNSKEVVLEKFSELEIPECEAEVSATKVRLMNRYLKDVSCVESFKIPKGITGIKVQTECRSYKVGLGQAILGTFFGTIGTANPATGLREFLKLGKGSGHCDSEATLPISYLNHDGESISKELRMERNSRYPHPLKENMWGGYPIKKYEKKALKADIKAMKEILNEMKCD